MIALAYSNANQRADVVRSTGHNLDTDEGLETAVLVSLFTDARAQESDDLDPRQDRRGWWGSIYLDDPSELGSRLWLLLKGKLTTAALTQCAEFAKEALQWLVDGKIAASVDVTVTRLLGKRDVALMNVAVQRKTDSAPRFQRAWEVQFGLG